MTPGLRDTCTRIKFIMMTKFIGTAFAKCPATTVLNLTRTYLRNYWSDDTDLKIEIDEKKTSCFSYRTSKNQTYALRGVSETVLAWCSEKSPCTPCTRRYGRTRRRTVRPGDQWNGARRRRINSHGSLVDGIIMFNV